MYLGAAVPPPSGDSPEHCFPSQEAPRSLRPTLHMPANTGQIGAKQRRNERNHGESNIHVQDTDKQIRRHTDTQTNTDAHAQVTELQGADLNLECVHPGAQVVNPPRPRVGENVPARVRVCVRRLCAAVGPARPVNLHHTPNARHQLSASSLPWSLHTTHNVQAHALTRRRNAPPLLEVPCQRWPCESVNVTRTIVSLADPFFKDCTCLQARKQAYTNNNTCQPWTSTHTHAHTYTYTHTRTDSIMQRLTCRGWSPSLWMTCGSLACRTASCSAQAMAHTARCSPASS